MDQNPQQFSQRFEENDKLFNPPSSGNTLKTFIFGFVSAVMVISVGVGGYILATTQHQQVKVATLKKTLTPTPFPTAIYKDSYFGYTFSYPMTPDLTGGVWKLRRTYGPDIQKLAPTDILSGFDLTYMLTANNQTYSNGVFVGSMLDGHGATDTQQWITQYDLNYPKNATKVLTTFNGYPAVVYSSTTNYNTSLINHKYVYFLAKGHAFRLDYAQDPEISQNLEDIVNSFQP